MSKGQKENMERPENVSKIKAFFKYPVSPYICRFSVVLFKKKDFYLFYIFVYFSIISCFKNYLVLLFEINFQSYIRLSASSTKKFQKVNDEEAEDLLGWVLNSKGLCSELDENTQVCSLFK